MPPHEILVYRLGADWCVRSPAALFERIPSEGAALKVARAHAAAAWRAGEPAKVRVRG